MIWVLVVPEDAHGRLRPQFEMKCGRNRDGQTETGRRINKYIHITSHRHDAMRRIHLPLTSCS